MNWVSHRLRRKKLFGDAVDAGQSMPDFAHLMPR